MLRYGCQAACFLLLTAFATSVAVKAWADEDTPLPTSPAGQSPLDELQMVPGDGQSGYPHLNQQGRPRDLTLDNFFSAGWDDDWAKQVRDTGTLNLALLRVQTSFMEREFRANYYVEPNVAGTTKSVSDLDALIAWSFNRRLMIEVTGAYQWTDLRTGQVETGGFPGLVGRVQLVDTESSSYSFNLKLAAPNQELGVTQSTISYGLAGFEDLDYWFGLKRVGFYYSFLFDSLDGPAAAGAKQNDIGYDITLAKTITAPDTPIFGNLTLFVENYAQSDLDGSHNGRTLVSITPGVRFNLGKSDNVKMGKDNWIMLGTDIPVSTYQPWEALYRLTYIKNF